MLDREILPTPAEIIEQHIVFFSRWEVQVQWLAIVLCLLAGWLLSKWLWRWLQYRFPRSTTFEWSDRRLSWREYGAVLIQSLDFPLVVIVLLILNQIVFQRLGWILGLLTEVTRLMGTYLGYRFVLATLYSAFPLKRIQKYQSRLLTPLFVLYVARTIVGLFQDLSSLTQVSPFKLFNTPVTMSNLFWLTAGLYFWIEFVSLFEDFWLIVASSKKDSDQGTIEATLILLHYFLITLGIILILGYVGFDGRAIATVTGGLSVGIGFGLKEVVSNFISGIVLLFEKVLKPGDIISIEGDTCEVQKLGVRATTVKKLLDNSEKIIPNQTFFTSEITTYTGSDRLVYCSILVGVGYSSNVEQVLELLLKIAKQHANILLYPSPAAFFLNFGDSSLNFELKFWLSDINIRKRVISDLNCQILDIFAQYNIEIPFPQQDIHIRKD
jgi:potassium efflux system protein